jgi:hypothetical protein
MINRYQNNDQDINKTQQIGNLRRRPDGICSTLNTCGLTTVNRDQNQPIVYEKKLLKNSIINLTTPFKPKTSFITIVICILLLLLLTGICIYFYRRYSKNKKIV